MSSAPLLDDRTSNPVGRRAADFASIATRAGQSKFNDLVTGITAAIGALLLGLQFDLLDGVTISLIFGIVTIPLWVPKLKLFRGARLLMAAGLLAVVGGVVLAQTTGHRVLPSSELRDVTELLAVIVGAGFVLWARSHISPAIICILVAIGMLLAIDPSAPRYVDDPWRFGYSVPVTLLVVAVAQLTRNRVIEIGAVLLFAFVASFSNARSIFAILLLTALAMAWQFRPKPKSRAMSATLLVVFGSALAYGIYNLGVSLILEGALGAEAQARSITQIQQAGSLLLGGRPELGATAALFTDNPFGFGAGAAVNIGELHRAQAGMAAIGYNPDNNYVYKYMFGTGIELHSTAADIWANFGLLGLLFVAVFAFAAIRGTALSIAGGTASGVLVFLTIKTLWNIGFSPLDTSFVFLALTLGLAIPLKSAMPTFAEKRLSRRVRRIAKRKPPQKGTAQARRMAGIR
jgi:hypothetical protein